MNPTVPKLTAAALFFAGTMAVAGTETGKGSSMPHHVRGPFDVKVAPVADQPYPEGTRLGRYSIDKKYHGELDAVGTGEMLTAGTPVQGSAVYVAIERVEGTLAGRRGTFVLQHTGRMSGAGTELEIVVAPDSGTGELTGLTGRLQIEFGPKGEHSYDFEYRLEPRP